MALCDAIHNLGENHSNVKNAINHAIAGLYGTSSAVMFRAQSHSVGGWVPNGKTLISPRNQAQTQTAVNLSCVRLQCIAV